MQHRESSKSKALLFPQLPELGHIACPGSAVPALHSGYPQQADLPRLLPAEPGAASALCASTYVQKEEFSAGRCKTGALTLKELYKPLHKLHPASWKGSQHGAAAVSTEQHGQEAEWSCFVAAAAEGNGRNWFPVLSEPGEQKASGSKEVLGRMAHLQL